MAGDPRPTEAARGGGSGQPAPLLRVWRSTGAEEILPYRLDALPSFVWFAVERRDDNHLVPALRLCNYAL